jgi:tRNA (guanine-N7-)-methyltransferase
VIGDDDESGRQGPGAAELRSFGRRRGRKPSPRQQGLLERMLPRLRIARAEAEAATPESLFGPGIAELWLEIGFGGGEHLVWQAERNAGVGLIGCEPFVDGVVKVLSAVEERRLANIRIHDGDARDLLRWLPAASIGRAFILFPDPWPKARHRKRRLVNPHLLGLLARVMRPSAELRIATDIGDYVRSMLVALARSPDFAWQVRGPEDWRARPADWPETRYERKARREGQACYYLSFRRV